MPVLTYASGVNTAYLEHVLELNMNYAIGYLSRPPSIEGSDDRTFVGSIVSGETIAPAIEMGAELTAIRHFFMKPADAIVENGATIPIPAN